jgi:hypothetical protein
MRRDLLGAVLPEKFLRLIYFIFRSVGPQYFLKDVRVQLKVDLKEGGWRKSYHFLQKTAVSCGYQNQFRDC